MIKLYSNWLTYIIMRPNIQYFNFYYFSLKPYVLVLMFTQSVRIKAT